MDGVVVTFTARTGPDELAARLRASPAPAVAAAAGSTARRVIRAALRGDLDQSHRCTLVEGGGRPYITAVRVDGPRSTDDVDRVELLRCVSGYLDVKMPTRWQSSTTVP